MAASATFALKAGVWFRRGRLLMVSPGSRGTACPLSGRNSTYRPVQISGTGSDGRIPSIEDGASWPILLQNYKPATIVKEFLFLHRNKNAKSAELFRIETKTVFLERELICPK